MKTYSVLITGLLICLFSISTRAESNDVFKQLRLVETCLNDSDSVFVGNSFPVNAFDNRLYQQGIQIGTFDKKTAMKKGQLSVVIQIYDMNGKAVAQAIAAGVNASFAITIFDGDIRLSEDFSFDHEAEEFALLLRKKGKL